MHKTESNKGTLLSEILNIIKIGGVIIVPGQGKIPVFIRINKFCEQENFLIFFLWVNLAIMLHEILKYVLVATLINN